MTIIKHKCKNLFSTNADAKTVKGNKLGFLTAIMYLAPSDLSGYEVCPFALKAQCKIACLFTAGRGAMSYTQKCRIAKTKRFFEDRINFMADIVYSIRILERRAKRENLIPLVRLNGTSDVEFEKIPLIVDGIEYANIFEVFPHVDFYDYTKIPTRKNIPSNYDLTFSYSGVASFASTVAKASLNNALSRIAVVFDKPENFPKRFLNRDVIIGDNSDVRHIDPKNSIVALYAKGKAKKDTSGFVVYA
jgi:hypothetical protein